MRNALIILTITVAIIFTVSMGVGVGQENSSENQGSVVAQSKLDYIYIVNEYRYSPTESEDDKDTGQSLCGTRCNAMSADYKNYLYPGGWRMKRVARDQELVVDLNNPFIKGKCICVADKYLIKVHDLYMSTIKIK